MSNAWKIAAAAALLVSAASAHAATVDKQLAGKSIAIDVECVDTVTIEPDTGLAGQVNVAASSSDASLLQDFVFADGETASVTRRHRRCDGHDPKVDVAIRLPAGMAIDIRNGGATGFAIGAVGGALHAALGGSGSLKAASVTSLDLDIAGSSDVHVGQANGPANIHIAGSGNAAIDAASLPSLTIEVMGSGSVAIGPGTVDALKASIAGSGNVAVKASIKDADLSTTGSGNIDVYQLSGALRSKSAGSGKVRIGRS